MPVTAQFTPSLSNRGKCVVHDREATRMCGLRYRVVGIIGNHPYIRAYARLIAALFALLGSGVSPSLGDIGDPVTTISPQPAVGSQFCSIGLAFDGSSLHFNRCGDPNIYAISPVNGTLVRTFDTGIPEWPAAMAYDAKRNGLWFGTQKGTGVTGFSGCGSIGMPIYFWDFGDDSVTLVFSIQLDEANPATGDPFFALCILDGLDYHENNAGIADDDEVWISE